MFNPHKLILPRGKKKKIGGIICPSLQSYRLKELRFDHKPSGPKACVINMGKKKHIFSMLRDKHLKYFLYLPILLTCLYNNF